MNVYDSGQIQNRLAPLGYNATDDPELADVILVNTCTIRDKAEQKAFSFLGRLAPLKARNPELIIGIGGCVAQQEGKRILKRMPYVDMVFGTHAIARLPGLIERIAATRCRLVDVEISEQISPDDYALGDYPPSSASAFVTIMRGCDNYCTYCVVPYVRGRESSRETEDILSEIRHLVSKGVREVTLLGQNVNSYGRKEGLHTFPQLLERVDAIDGLERIRFTTSHPKDLSDELIGAFDRLAKLCRHIHLPVQSGSDRVLKRMNRRYTRNQYVERVSRLRDTCPEIAITSDIIVGFPGESQADFESTLSLIREIGYDGLFAFIYSDRPNAPAVRFEEKVPEATKKQRLQAVLECQEKYTLQRNRQLIGTVQEVLVDGLHSAKAPVLEPGTDQSQCTGLQWSGRTTTNKIVHFDAHGAPFSDNQMLTGQLLQIMIEKAMPHCLWGSPSDPVQLNQLPGKGEKIHAA